VGKRATREAFGLVATLPHSAAHATVFTFGRTTADFCTAALGCCVRLGGVPEAAVVDNEGCAVAGRPGRARLVDEVAALFGHLLLRPVILRPRFPEGKGQDERTVGYLQTSFLPLRRFEDLADLQAQHDHWTETVVFRRHHRRVGAKVGDALRVERGYLRALPDPLPDLDRRLEVRVTKDGFVRVGDVDYSVPPGLSGATGRCACFAGGGLGPPRGQAHRSPPPQLGAGRCGPGPSPRSGAEAAPLGPSPSGCRRRSGAGG
jgi:hypothetical protein